MNIKLQDSFQQIKTALEDLQAIPRTILSTPMTMKP